MTIPMPVPPIQPVYKTTSHGVHVFLSIITLGLWLFVWPLVALGNNASNKSARENYQQQLAEYTQAMQMYQEAQTRLR